jgi:hypothetical protein
VKIAEELEALMWCGPALLRHSTCTSEAVLDARASHMSTRLERAHRPMGARPRAGRHIVTTRPCRPPNLEGTATRTNNKDFSWSFPRHS